jgi:predicted MFS family arabinose efflux permease
MMGVFNMSMSAGILVGSLAAGLLVDSYGVEYAFPFVAVALLISTIVSALMIKAGSAQESEPGLSGSADGVASMGRVADD